MRVSSVAGTRIQFVIYSTRFTWITARGPSMGIAEVWVNGRCTPTLGTRGGPVVGDVHGRGVAVDLAVCDVPARPEHARPGVEDLHRVDTGLELTD